MGGSPTDGANTRSPVRAQTCMSASNAAPWRFDDSRTSVAIASTASSELPAMPRAQAASTRTARSCPEPLTTAVSAPVCASVAIAPSLSATERRRRASKPGFSTSSMSTGAPVGGTLANDATILRLRSWESVRSSMIRVTSPATEASPAATRPTISSRPHTLVAASPGCPCIRDRSASGTSG